VIGVGERVSGRIAQEHRSTRASRLRTIQPIQPITITPTPTLAAGFSTGTERRMVAPSFVMVIRMLLGSPTDCNILSMPLGPRVVLTRSAMAMAPTKEDMRALEPLKTSASDDTIPSADIVWAVDGPGDRTARWPVLGGIVADTLSWRMDFKAPSMLTFEALALRNPFASRPPIPLGPGTAPLTLKGNSPLKAFRDSGNGVSLDPFLFIFNFQCFLW
jgi:hypothetical protein